MRYIEPFTFLFRQSHATMTLLVGSVLFFIPIVGPIVVMGWCVLVHRALAEGREEVPPLTFDDFSRLLNIGLGPFLVSLLFTVVAMVVLLPLLAISWIGSITLIPLLANSGDETVAILVGLAAGLVALLLFVFLGYLFAMVHKAALMHAELTPSTARAFEAVRWSFLKEAFRVVKHELLFASVVHSFGNSLLMALGICLGSIGIYPAAVIVQAAGAHFRAQIYRRYLERGGTPIQIEPLPQPAVPSGRHPGPGATQPGY